MKSFVLHLLIAFSHLLRYINSLIWNLKLKKTDTLSILKGKEKIFTRFGEIEKMLYSTQHLIYFNKGFEHKTLQKYQSVLFNGAIVLDIGANIGLFSVLGSELVGENGRILAFEPSKKTYEALVENLKLNKCSNVEPFQLALSDSEGMVQLARPKGSEDAFNHMSFDVNDTNNIMDNTAKMCRLDLFLEEKQITNVDIIKIDVEGAEYLSLKGAEGMFNKGIRPVIIMECYEPWCKRFNISVFDTLKYLSQFGYKFEQYDEHQWLVTPL